MSKGKAVAEVALPEGMVTLNQREVDILLINMHKRIERLVKLAERDNDMGILADALELGEVFVKLDIWPVKQGKQRKPMQSIDNLLEKLRKAEAETCR